MEPNQVESQNPVDQSNFNVPSVSADTSSGMLDGGVKKPRKKALLIVGAVLIGVLMLSGLVGAVLYRKEKNKPENVLAESIKNLLIDEKDQRIEMTTKVELANNSLGFNEVEIKADAQNSGRNVQTDFEVNLSVLRLRGAVQVRENGDIYVKVKDLPALLSSDFAAASGVPEEFKTRLSELDDKWVEIKREDVSELSGDSEYSNLYEKCLDSVYALRTDKEFGKLVEKSYLDNRFMTVKSSSEEVVDDAKLLKIEVGLDEGAAKTFGKAMEESRQIKSIVESCTEGSSASSGEAEETDDIQNGKMAVWIDRGKRELKMVEMSGETTEKDREETGFERISLNLKMVEIKNKIEKPMNAVNIKDLLAQFGVDESGLNSSQFDGDVEPGFY